MGDHTKVSKMCQKVLCLFVFTIVFTSLFPVHSALVVDIAAPHIDTSIVGQRSLPLEPYPKWSFTENRIRTRRDVVYDICQRKECTCVDFRPGIQTNVTCRFKKHEDFTIRGADLPPSTNEFRVSGCRRLTVAAHAFSLAHNFDILHVADTRTVLVQADAFLVSGPHMTPPAVRALMHRCGSVVVHERGFRVNKERVIFVEMVDVAEVKISERAFEYLQNATFRNISRMVLKERSFSYQTHISSQGPTTTMLFQNVNFGDIPRETFRTTADEISMINCDIPLIREHAFSAKLYHSILLLNSSVRRIEPGAFSADTLVTNLTIASCIIGDLNVGALQAAVTGLRFVKNRIGNLRTRALNMTAVTLYFANNEVELCESDAISLRQWTNITLQENSFYDIQGSPVASNLQRDENTGYDINDSPKPFLSFTHNNIRKLADNSLSFLHDYNIHVDTHHNYFLERCRCELDQWLARKHGVDNAKFTKDFLKTSYCTVDVMLARCMNQPDGNMLMETYLSNICTPTENISCQPSLGQPIIVNDELQNPRFPTKQTDNRDEPDLVLWLSIGASVIVVIVASTALVACLLCRSKNGNCCSSENGSSVTSDIVARMDTEHRERNDTAIEQVIENDTQPYQYQVTRTEEDGQLHPLLTNERLAELNQRWQSEDEAVRQAACEEIVKLYQTIKRQNNNELPTPTAPPRSESGGLYETIEDAARRPPDLLQTAVAVNDYALPHDVVPGYGVRSEYSEPSVDRGALMGAAYAGRPLSSLIPFMDGATMGSDRSGASSSSGKMINRPLPRPPSDLLDK